MKLVFTGDFSASGIFFQKISSGDEILDKGILSVFREADYVNINLENPITNASFRKKKGSALKAPLNTAGYLRERYINICTLANNHIMDCGNAGLNDTIDSLNENEIKFYGIGGHHPYLLLNRGNIKVALIASCHREGPLWDGHNPAPFHFQIKDLERLIKEIKDNDNPDYVIFSYHGGTEFNIIPEPKRRRFFHRIIDLGVDVIIGHHAHVPQGIEIKDKGIIVYGLGNFCFDTPYQRKHQYTSESYFIEIDLAQSKFPSINKYHLKIDRDAGYVSLDTDRIRSDHFNDKLQVFQTSREYNTNWEKDAFRVYIGDKSTTNKDSSDDGMKGSAPSIRQNKLMRNSINKRGFVLTTLYLMKMVISDVTKPSRRPLLIGAVKYILKGSARGTA